MKPEELRIIVEQAIAGQFNSIWLVVALTSLITGGVGSFIGAYMKRKGENVATKEDFELILSQLTEQVRATEQIKAEISSSQVATTEQINQAISNDYWKNQEWSKTRKIKLEELVNSAFELRQLINHDADKLREEYYINDTDSIFNGEPSQVIKIEMLSFLYFHAELYLESLELSLSYRELQRKIIEQFNMSKSNIAITTQPPKFSKEDFENKRMEISQRHIQYIHSFNAFQRKVEQIFKMPDTFQTNGGPAAPLTPTMQGSDGK